MICHPLDHKELAYTDRIKGLTSLGEGEFIRLTLKKYPSEKKKILNLKETIKTQPPKPYCTIKKQMALAVLCWKAAFNYQSGYYQQMGTEAAKPNSRRGGIWLGGST